MLVDLSGVEPGCCVQPGGQRRLQLLHVLFGRSDDRQRCFVADPENIDHRRPLPIEGGLAVVLLEPVFHGGDVANTHLRSVGWAQKDDVFELIATISPLGGSKQHLAAGGLHAASGKLDRRRPDSCRDLVESQMVLSKLGLWDLDADLEGTNAG